MNNQNNGAKTDTLLETDRLCLVPLSAAQLNLWLTNLPLLEAELNCHYQAQPLEGFFRNIVEGQAQKTKADQANWLFHTFWFIIRKQDRVVVGSADFKSPPDQNGSVEIGYGLAPPFEHNGYMTESIAAMCHWAWQQPAVHHILAETEPDNLPSQRVLQRCGFAAFTAKNDNAADGLTPNCWWRLSFSPSV